MSKGRDDRKRNGRATPVRATTRTVPLCPKCHQPGRHFAPPALVGPGWYPYYPIHRLATPAEQAEAATLG